MEKYWKTKEGKLIEYKKIKNDHLLNILSFIKRRAKEGVEVVWDFGTDFDGIPDGEIEMVYGKRVEDIMDYKGLLKEAKKRKLL